MNIAKPLFSAVAMASLTLAGCSSAPGEVEERTGSAQQDAITLNAITLNAITLNAITLNAITLNAITLNAITLNAITLNGLKDPTARDVFSYVVSCALPESETLTLNIEGVDYSFPGQLGLAPEWGKAGGDCDGKCQEWVSACVLSRVDYLGVAEPISVRGDNPGLKSSPAELSAYTQREATYYGNIFSSPQKFYACLPPGQTEIPRVCGPSIETCGIDVLGSCDDLCGHPRPDGSYPNCTAPDADDGGHKKADRDDMYHGSITVFLKP
jgi:hypothetical protein